MLRSLARWAPSPTTARVFDSHAKPSVKVYHLQEYAKYRNGLLNQASAPAASPASTAPRGSCTRDIALYRKIDDWRLLVSEVNACIRDLSPAQLVAAAVAYWRLGRVGRPEWKRLCAAAARYAYNPNANVAGISSSEVSLILCCYARVFYQQVPQSLSLLKWVVRDIGRLNERDVCMILFYIRRMRCVPANLENPDHQMYAGMLRAIVMGLAAEGGNKLSRFSTRGLVCLVSNLAYIGHIPWSLVYHACNVIGRNVGELDTKGMAIHTRSLAMLGFPDRRTLASFANLTAEMKRLDTATITCMLHSYAKLRFRPRGHLSTLLEQVHKGIFLFKDNEVAQVTFALGQLGYQCQDVFESIFTFLENRIAHQGPQNVSMFMQGFAKVGVYKCDVVDLLVTHAKSTISGFSFSQVVSLLDACVVLGHYDPDAYRLLLSAITKQSEDAPSDGIVNQLNRIMYCIRLEHPEFIDRASPSTKTLIDIYRGQFMAQPPSEPRERIYESLRNLDIEHDHSVAIGPYRVDVLLPGNRTLDILSEASLCPITRGHLGAVQLKTRHLRKLGYHPTHLIRREWFRKGPNSREALLREALGL